MQAQQRTVEFDFSNPALYNSVYIPLFRNRARFLHLYGSAGSGKSVFGCQREIVKSFREERRGRKTLVIRKVYKTILNSVYSQLKATASEWQIADCFDFLKSPLQITNKVTDVSFIFVGLDDVEKVKSVQGVDRILIEEATELDSLSDLDQLSLRLRGFSEVQITLMYNPVNVHHWLNKEIHEKRPPQHNIFKTTYRDNEKLLAADPEYGINMELLKETNPNYYRVYGLGLWGVNQEGLIYPDYETVAEMPPPQAYGLDFGYNDPSSLVAVSAEDEPGKDGKNLYWEELLYETKHTSATLIKRFDELGVDKNVPINADSARPEMIKDLRDAGYTVNACVKYPGSVLAGINLVKKHNLKIVAGSKNLFKEIENYSWKKNKNGILIDDEPADTINHAMDGGRYGTEQLSQGGHISVGPAGGIVKQHGGALSGVMARLKR